MGQLNLHAVINQSNGKIDNLADAVLLEGGILADD
jgi:hypothetical protein